MFQEPRLYVNFYTGRMNILSASFWLPHKAILLTVKSVCTFRQNGAGHDSQNSALQDFPETKLERILEMNDYKIAEGKLSLFRKANCQLRSGHLLVLFKKPTVAAIWLLPWRTSDTFKAGRQHPFLLTNLNGQNLWEIGAILATNWAPYHRNKSSCSS